MSVLIKGMEMPRKCDYCPLAHISADIEIGDVAVVCKFNHELLEDDWEGQHIERPDWCPLVEVSTPHGRLIDEDEITSELNRLLGKYGFSKEHYDAFRSILYEVEYIPTIIEAEE